MKTPTKVWRLHAVITLRCRIDDLSGLLDSNVRWHFSIAIRKLEWSGEARLMDEAGTLVPHWPSNMRRKPQMGSLWRCPFFHTSVMLSGARSRGGGYSSIKISILEDYEFMSGGSSARGSKHTPATHMLAGAQSIYFQHACEPTSGRRVGDFAKKHLRAFGLGPRGPICWRACSNFSASVRQPLDLTSAEVTRTLVSTTVRGILQRCGLGRREAPASTQVLWPWGRQPRLVITTEWSPGAAYLSLFAGGVKLLMRASRQRGSMARVDRVLISG
jgi:hypothetical protein